MEKEKLREILKYKLQQYIDMKKDEFDFEIIIEVLGKVNVKNAWIEEVTDKEDEVLFLYNSYNVILKELYNENKDLCKRRKVQKTKKNSGSGFLTATYLTGCFISGIKKGLGSNKK